MSIPTNISLVPPLAEALPRFAEFVRVSTAGQYESDTEENQKAALDRMRVSRRGEFVARIESEDGHISGMLPLDKRPDYLQLKALVEAGKIDEVRVVAFDRLTRNADARVRAAVIGMLKDAGVKVVETASGVTDLANDMGELSADLRLRFAAWESQAIRRRTLDGKAQKAAGGRWIGGCLPWGLKNDKERKVVFIDDALGDRSPAAIIKEAFRAIVHIGLWPLAKQLNASDTPSPKGLPWAAPTLSQMLRNPAYKGVIVQHVRGKEYVSSIPAIVTPEDWQAAQVALDSRLQRRSGRPATIEALMRKRIYCECGERARLRRTGNELPTYVCRTMLGTPGLTPCGARRRLVEQVDRLCYAALVERLQKGATLLDEAVSGEMDSDVTWESQIGKSERKLAALDREALQIVRLRASETISEDAAAERLGQITRERRDAEKSRETAREAIAARQEARQALASMEERLAALRGNMDGADFAARQALVQVFVPDVPGFGVTLHRDGRIVLRAALGPERVPEPSKLLTGS